MSEADSELVVKIDVSHTTLACNYYTYGQSQLLLWFRNNQ